MYYIFDTSLQMEEQLFYIWQIMSECVLKNPNICFLQIAENVLKRPFCFKPMSSACNL